MSILNIWRVKSLFKGELTPLHDAGSWGEETKGGLSEGLACPARFSQGWRTRAAVFVRLSWCRLMVHKRTSFGGYSLLVASSEMSTRSGKVRSR